MVLRSLTRHEPEASMHAGARKSVPTSGRYGSESTRVPYAAGRARRTRQFLKCGTTKWFAYPRKNTDTKFFYAGGKIKLVFVYRLRNVLLRATCHQNVPRGRAASFAERRSTAKLVPLLKCKLLGQLHRRWGWDIRIYDDDDLAGY